jgi:hypothetical protein
MDGQHSRQLQTGVMDWTLLLVDLLQVSEYVPVVLQMLAPLEVCMPVKQLEWELLVLFPPVELE